MTPGETRNPRYFGVVMTALALGLLFWVMV
jgi:hypothetical protein